MSGRTPGDKKDPQPTLDDLSGVDTTNPLLKPVATITLDEEPEPAIEPSATQLLNPIDDAPTDPKQKARPAAVKVLDVSADGPMTQPMRRRAALKSDAFESLSPLAAVKRDDASRGPPAPWKKTSVWTPGLVVLTLIGVLMLMLALFVLLRS